MTATAFEILHQDRILGKLIFFDRLLFRGNLTGLQPQGAMKALLNRQGVLLKDYDSYVKTVTAELKANLLRLAERAGAPYQYLEGTYTKAVGRSKEELARRIAQENGVRQGLVCVLSAVEPCTSFDVGFNQKLGELDIVRRKRKCQHFYLYYLHPRLGLIHIRLQSWFPFPVQIWVNGREMLARALDEEGIGYRRHANTFLKVDDWDKAQAIANRLARMRWPRLLDGLVGRLNPVLSTLAELNFGGYYWVAEQAELATDLAFTHRPALEELLPDLFTHANAGFSSQDTLKFLGRKLHPNLAAEVATDHRRRPEGWRVKHRFHGNSIKMYDKVSVLRVETTINNPAQLRTLRVVDGRQQWCPLRKGVANLPRYFQVGQGANHRYLDALGAAQQTHVGKKVLHQLLQPREHRGRRFARLNPVDPEQVQLFRVILAGEHTITGFRNKDLAHRLHPTPDGAKPNRAEAKRICAKISRQIAKLRAHRLIYQVPRRRLYRPTHHGLAVMTATLAFHDREFPAAYTAAKPP